MSFDALEVRENTLVLVEESGDEGSAGAAAVGGVISVRVHFKVDGLGSFKAGTFNTALGHVSGFVKPGTSLNLLATPAPRNRFSHWLLNGNFAGSDPKNRAFARAGLTITAVFEAKSSVRAADASRSIIDGWDISGPGAEDTSFVPPNVTQCTFENRGPSPVDMFKNNRQIGFLGKGASHEVSVDSNDVMKVKILDSAAKDAKSKGNWVYD